MKQFSNPILAVRGYPLTAEYLYRDSILGAISPERSLKENGGDGREVGAETK